MASFMRVS